MGNYLSVPKMNNSHDKELLDSASQFVRANIPFIVSRHFSTLKTRVSVDINKDTCTVDIALPEYTLFPKETLVSIYSDLVSLANANRKQIAVLTFVFKYSKI